MRAKLCWVQGRRGNDLVGSSAMKRPHFTRERPRQRAAAGGRAAGFCALVGPRLDSRRTMFAAETRRNQLMRRWKRRRRSCRGKKFRDKAPALIRVEETRTDSARAYNERLCHGREDGYPFWPLKGPAGSRTKLEAPWRSWKSHDAIA